MINGPLWLAGGHCLFALYGKAAGKDWTYVILEADQIMKIERSYLGGSTIGKKVNLISKSGFYKLVMRSEKPRARAFHDWSSRDVLPTIRKDGGYELCARHRSLDGNGRAAGEDAGLIPWLTFQP